MTDTVTLTIDGHRLEVPTGTTLLDAAAQIGIPIPTMCYHPTLTANGLCRICSVEVEGTRTLVPSCVAKVAEGMVVHTESERVRRSRRTILEMLASAVDLSEAPEILAQMERYGADASRFAGTERREIPLLDDNPFYVRDYSKCILCWRCVQVCAEDVQHTFALNLSGRGFATTIGTFYQSLGGRAGRVLSLHSNYRSRAVSLARRHDDPSLPAGRGIPRSPVRDQSGGRG